MSVSADVAARSLAGQVVAVTGGSRGIGRAIAIDLARQGAFVGINFRQNETEAMAALTQVRAAGGDGKLFQADVSRPEQIEAWFKDLYKETGHIDVLITNAGITRDAPLLTMTAKDWHAVLDTNLNSAFYCSKAIVRRMCSAKRGLIVMIGSGSAFSPRVSQVNYSTSKSALIGFTRSLARELAPHGVRVNTVAPGFTATEMSASLSQSVVTESLAKIPLNRWGQPEEIAAFVSYLASPDAYYLTGQTLVVDGGRYAFEQQY